MKRHVFYSEFAYLCGLVLIALGAAIMERADFGMSMIVAPAYLLYRWLNPVWSFFTFGTAEYCFQAVLLVIMVIVLRRFRLSYLLSFVTAVIYGFILDGCMLLAALLPNTTVWRVVWYLLGMLLGSLGVAMMFRTYLSAEVYELFVKEVSQHFGADITKFKTWYDRASCLVGLILSFAFFGLWHFVGVKWGTIVCAVINGPIIGLLSRFLDARLEFRDLLPWRPFFTGESAPENSDLTAGS